MNYTKYFKNLLFILILIFIIILGLSLLFTGARNSMTVFYSIIFICTLVFLVSIGFTKHLYSVNKKEYVESYL